MTILTLFHPSNNFSRLAEAGLANIEDGGHLAPSSQFEVELDVIISQQVSLQLDLCIFQSFHIESKNFPIKRYRYKSRNNALTCYS